MYFAVEVHVHTMYEYTVPRTHVHVQGVLYALCAMRVPHVLYLVRVRALVQRAAELVARGGLITTVCLYEERGAWSV